MLSLWVVYQNPADYPGKYVARRWVGEQPTSDGFFADSIEPIREYMLQRGLTKLMRAPSDDPCIVETWL